MTVSKKTVAAIGAGLIVTCIAAYFEFLSPKSTEIKFSLSSSSLASNVNQTVTGSVSPAEAGRLISIEARASEDSWTEVARVVTDAVGSFKATFPMVKRGESDVRATVDSKGRQKAATADAQSVSVLDPTQVEVQIAKFARSDKTFRVPGRITPIASRTVRVESSSDGRTFSSVGQGTTNPATGQFEVKVVGLKPGSLTLRVSVDASASAAAVVGKPAPVLVEDYVAAGRKYLAIVTPANKAQDAWADSVDESLGSYKAAAERVSRANTRLARQLRQYAFWPQEVKGYIATIIKSSILDADYFHRLSLVKTAAETYDVSEPTYPKGSDNAGALARAAMGLPKRT